MKQPKPKTVRFDPSWVPKFRGRLLEWLDECVERTGIHPRQVADTPNVLMHAGVSRKLLTDKLLREASRATLPTVRAWASRHNAKVRVGKALGFVEIKDADWLATPDLIPAQKPPAVEVTCPSQNGKLSPLPSRPQSPPLTARGAKPAKAGPETSRPAAAAAGKGKSSAKSKGSLSLSAKLAAKGTSLKSKLRRK